MHILQERLLGLARKSDLGKMSLRQIASLVDEKHPQKVKHHLIQLEKKGFIKTGSDGSIYVVDTTRRDSFKIVSIPVVGSANCGDATIFADENVLGYLQVSETLLNRRTSSALFALTAQGYSMDNANIAGQNIEPGDFVVVDSGQKSPQNGDYVVSVIDGMSNIKKFWRDAVNNRIVLLSESRQDLPPIFIHQDDDYLINGKVVQVFKPFTKPASPVNP